MVSFWSEEAHLTRILLGNFRWPLGFLSATHADYQGNANAVDGQCETVRLDAVSI
ncbi:hypothetical protein BURMUCGD1_6591 [Burkholderia multivorans CGD1]|nr:hypothetical protein BURMUCGD1_6591 [Burkholderia multivorans CGD1]